ncbi:bone morphogenetic protein 2-like [Copidosoma floridanum]|uniref:bone morphogenetic protein 2-like n=1 Tax=Copidosoma floridanum TaxID=29053 RepID=UPI000C6F599C|nr:bone morphogenetic protein 2-like [Copidosoma floridanum]
MRGEKIVAISSIMTFLILTISSTTNAENQCGATVNDSMDESNDSLQELQKLREKFGNSGPLSYNETMPQYMLGLYILRTKSDWPLVPFNAKTVRCLIEKPVENTTSKLFFFNIVDSTYNKSLLGAQIHLYREHSLTSTENLPVSSPSYYEFSVYQVQSNETLDDPVFHKLLDKHTIAANVSSWLVFDVTPAVVSWLSGEHPNLGLIVVATTESGDHVQVDFVRRNKEPADDKSPILVIFNHDDNSTSEFESYKADFSSKQKNESLKIYEHAIKHPEFHVHRGKGEMLEEEKTPFVKSTTLTRNRRSVDKDNSPCAKYIFTAEFREVGYPFIISPDSYSTYECRGYCGQKRKIVTNYDLLQEIFDSAIPDLEVRNTCCAPTHMSNLTALIFDTYYNIIFTTIPDIGVERCSCQGRVARFRPGS